jgi:hypothetical protein
MKLSIRILICCPFLMVCSAISCFAKEWRGIVPLHSTRADVIKLLGNPRHGQTTGSEYFELADEKVTIKWIDPSCQRKYSIEEGAVVHPEDLVLTVKVFPNKPIPLPAQGVVINGGCSSNGWCYSFDEKTGYGFTIVGGITSLIYYPTGEEFKAWIQEHKGCQSSAEGAA